MQRSDVFGLEDGVVRDDGHGQRQPMFREGRRFVSDLNQFELFVSGLKKRHGIRLGIRMSDMVFDLQGVDDCSEILLFGFTFRSK